MSEKEEHAFWMEIRQGYSLLEGLVLLGSCTVGQVVSSDSDMFLH